MEGGNKINLTLSLRTNLYSYNLFVKENDNTPYTQTKSLFNFDEDSLMLMYIHIHNQVSHPQWKWQDN